MAEGGIGGGIAFNQKADIVTRIQGLQDLLRGFQPVPGEGFRVRGHGERQGKRRFRHRQSGALHDAQRIAFFALAPNGIGPDRLALQDFPGAAGNEARIAGAKGETVEGALFH